MERQTEIVTPLSSCQPKIVIRIYINYLDIPFACPDVNYNTESGRDPMKRIGAQWKSGVRSWEACSKLCQQRSDCKYWTWHHGKASGWSWSYWCVTMQDAGKRVYNTDTISGQRDCTGNIIV